MKKNFFTISFVLFTMLSSAVYGQKNLFDKGSFNLNLGYGLVPTFVADGGISNVPPINLRLGYAITENFNLSGYFGYSATTSKSNLYSDGLVTEFQNDFLMIGIRGEIRSRRSERFDLYGGFMLGYNQPFVNEVAVGSGEAIVRDPKGPRRFNEPTGQLLYSGFIGGTMYATRNIGLFAEVGYGISLANLGVSFKL